MNMLTIAAGIILAFFVIPYLLAVAIDIFGLVLSKLVLEPMEWIWDAGNKIFDKLKRYRKISFDKFQTRR